MATRSLSSCSLKAIEAMIPTPIPCFTYVFITSASVAVKTTFAFKPLSKKALSRSLLPVNPKTYVTIGYSAKCFSLDWKKN